MIKVIYPDRPNPVDLRKLSPGDFFVRLGTLFCLKEKQGLQGVVIRIVNADVEVWDECVDVRPVDASAVISTNLSIAQLEVGDAFALTGMPPSGPFVKLNNLQSLQLSSGQVHELGCTSRCIKVNVTVTTKDKEAGG